MNKIFSTLKDMFLDLYSMGKGFIYGFVMIGLFMLIVIFVVYIFLTLRNLILH